MKSLFWLLVSGVLWLALVQIAPHLGIPSQIISLARSGYIAIFSIYMMVELRGASYSSQYRPSHLYLYLLPLVSLVLLSLFSSDFTLNVSLLTVIGCFYLSAFALINRRSETGHIRNAGWDLLAPPMLLILMLHPVLTLVGGAAGVAYIVRLFLRPLEPAAEHAHLDSFIVQLPSICIAPVVLIALRDVFDGGGLIDRTHIESFGLIVNGVGAAVWTAMVMRSSFPLERAGLLLWVLGFAGAIVGTILPTGIVTSAGAILIAEGFRGAMWLGTTVALANLTRGKGLLANLAATILPLVALWIGKDHFAPATMLLLYAGFVLPIPLMAWAIVRQRGGRASRAESIDELPGDLDGPHTAITVLKKKL
jgi:hypothetical protein